MSWIVLLRPEAEQDLAAAHGWYEKKAAGLGDEFRDEFAVAMQLLETDPWPPRNGPDLGSSLARSLVQNPSPL
jgi:hypothetical protein